MCVSLRPRGVGEEGSEDTLAFLWNWVRTADAKPKQSGEPRRRTVRRLQHRSSHSTSFHWLVEVFIHVNAICCSFVLLILYQL